MRAAGFAATALLVLTPAAGAQTLRTLTASRQVHDDTALVVRVTYAVGHFRLTPGRAGELYRMELRYDEDKFTPVRAYDPATGELRLGLEGRGGHITYDGDHQGRTAPSLDLVLAPDVPLTLDVDLGAAQADVELGGLALRDLTYKTGASTTEVRFSRPNPIACGSLAFKAGAAAFEGLELGNANCRHISFEGGVGTVTLDFTGDWRTDATADLHVAVGKLRLRLPRDLGVELTLDRFLASFDQTGFTKRGDAYYSDNYRTAPHHLTLSVESAFGGVEVSWVEGPR
jgi:hypothetical protein